MKWLLAIIVSGVLAVGLASCSTGQIDAEWRESAYPSNPSGAEQYGPDGSIANMDLSGYDPVTREKIAEER